MEWEDYRVPPLSANAFFMFTLAYLIIFMKTHLEIMTRFKSSIEVWSQESKRNYFQCLFVLLTEIWSPFLLEMSKMWIGKNTVHFFTVTPSYLSWVVECSLVPAGKYQLASCFRISPPGQDGNSAEREALSDCTLRSDLWNRRTLTFDH